MKICSHSPHPVQESFLAVELLWHVLSFTTAAALSEDSVNENGGYQCWIFNGGERPREVRRIHGLVQLNQAKSVICRFVHESQLHVATQLFVGQLQKILGNKRRLAKKLQPQQLPKQLNC